MRKLLVFAMLLAIVGSAMAFDLGNNRPVKPEVNYPQNVPSDLRQGGDTILDAVVVTLPVVNGSGTTVGYNDDYDEACPYTLSTSPDVVYTTTPDADVAVTIDLLGSTYDTKVYVYDQNLALVACNDDFYPDYVSKLENVPLMGGVQYYVIVDGYGGASGNYVINIDTFEPCVVTCPAGAEIEGEPALVDGYADAYNGGCNSPEFGNPFGAITQSIFCGVSGWYISAEGTQSRDTDWFTMTVPLDGFVEVIGDAEFATYMFELGPQDCGSVAVIQNVVIGPCTEGTMTIPGAAGSTIWFWVGPTTFDGSGEYDYVLYTNLVGVATESHSWTDVKGLF
ncbi:MAG: hypothetical protein R3D98_04510 [Candidatus Krumholzibacteriia bacterium]